VQHHFVAVAQHRRKAFDRWDQRGEQAVGRVARRPAGRVPNRDVAHRPGQAAERDPQPFGRGRSGRGVRGKPDVPLVHGRGYLLGGQRRARVLGRVREG
jgi:hypothetical protein